MDEEQKPEKLEPQGIGNEQKGADFGIDDKDQREGNRGGAAEGR